LLRRCTSPRAEAVGWLAVWGTAALLAVLSAADVPVWRSDVTLTLTEYRSDTNFLPALAGYASSLRRAGLRHEAIAANDRVVARIFPTQRTLEERVAAIDTAWMLRHVKSMCSLRYQPRALVDYVMRERGGGEQELGLFLPAIEDYRLALAVQPNDYEVADALVYCCEVSGKYADAREVLARLVAAAPSSARFQRLGGVEMHLGEWAAAKQSYAHALALAIRERRSDTAAILRQYEKAEAAAAVRSGSATAPSVPPGAPRSTEPQTGGRP
jgi:tetratricopeptide (TPR) repeat protein